MKLTPFISGLIVIGLLSSLVTLFIVGIYGSYSGEISLPDYNSSRYTHYDKMGEIYIEMNESHKSLEEANDPGKGITERLTGFLGGVVAAGKALLGTVSTAGTLVDAGISDANLGESGTLLKTALLALLFLGTITAIMAMYLRVNEI